MPAVPLSRMQSREKPSVPEWPYRAIGVHRLVVETGADHVKRCHCHSHGHTAHHSPRQHRRPAALPEPLREAPASAPPDHNREPGEPEGPGPAQLPLTWRSQTQSLAEAKVASCTAEPTATRGTAPVTPRHSPTTPCCS